MGPEAKARQRLAVADALRLLPLAMSGDLCRGGDCQHPDCVSVRALLAPKEIPVADPMTRDAMIARFDELMAHVVCAAVVLGNDNDVAGALEELDRADQVGAAVLAALRAAPPADALVEAQHRAERAEGRLREISDLLEDAGVPGGTTIYGGVMMLRERAERAESSLCAPAVANPLTDDIPALVAELEARAVKLRAEVTECGVEMNEDGTPVGNAYQFDDTLFYRPCANCVTQILNAQWLETAATALSRLATELAEVKSQLALRDAEDYDRQLDNGFEHF